ncbi:MAG: peptidoglycan-binding protein [Methylocystis sp.]|uniref:C40 family peptidase n=1 Tax=Methylocystis sp. TaxID=1911079 RepID=UPI003D14B3FC
MRPQGAGRRRSWCAAFVGACLSLAGYRNSGSLAARSYENFGRDLHGAPEHGAIVVFPRGAPNSGKGHVGFVERVEGDQIVYVSGNLSDMVKRDTRPKSDMIACRLPLEIAPLPQTFLPTIVQIAQNEAPPHLRGGVAGDIITPPVSEVKALDEIAEGAVGPAVEALQRALRDAGLSPGEIDGEFGPNTRNAVALFQQSRELPATGVADERTLSLLNIPAHRQMPAVIGPEVQRREERERFLERLVRQLVNGLTTRDASSPDASATDTLSNLLRQALAPKPNGQAAEGTAGADAALRRLLQAALQGAGAKPAGNGALPTSDDIAKALPMSPIDKALGGEALVGLKTPAAIGAYAALSIFQTLGIAGPATATAAQPPSTTSQVLLTLIGAFGALGGVSKVDRAVRALSLIAAKR